MGKFGFVTWDWKGSLDLGEVKELRKIFGEPVTTTEVVDDGTDSFTAAVHTEDLNLNGDDWAAIEFKMMDGDEDLFKYEIPGQNQVFKVTQKQLKALVAPEKSNKRVVLKGNHKRPKPFTVEE